MGNTAAALPLYEEEVRMSRQMLGAEHPDTLVAQDNFGLARCDAAVEALDIDALDEGLGLLRQAVAGMRKVLGENDEQTRASAENLREFEQLLEEVREHDETESSDDEEEDEDDEEEDDDEEEEEEEEDEDEEEQEEEETIAERMRKRRRFR